MLVRQSFPSQSYTLKQICQIHFLHLLMRSVNDLCIVFRGMLDKPAFSVYISFNNLLDWYGKVLVGM